MAEEVPAAALESPAGAPAAPASTEAPVGAPAGPERDPAKPYTQAEVDAITAKVRKNERYRTRKEVEAYYQGRESVAQPAKPAEPPSEDKAPERSNYSTYEEYVRADAAYVGRKAAEETLSKHEKASAEKREAEERTARASKFQETVRTKFPDIDSRLGEVGDMPMYRGVQEAISESEFGAEIFNDLVSKPAEFERLSKMSETSAVREIGKMEARIEAAARAPKPEGAPTEPANQPAAAKEPSKAPTPIRPVTATKAADPSDLTRLVDKPDEWRRARERELHKRRTGG